MEHIFKTAQYLKKHVLRPNVVGMTMVELLIVIGIIGVLFVAMGIIFNPFAQIEKTKNANREHDMTAIQQALDSYLNDTGCYPTSIPFGSVWSVGSTVYMEKVPEDPDCSSSNPYSCYDYQTDGTSCPKWNILYVTLHAPLLSGSANCIVSSSCAPQGGMQTYNYCAVSGEMNCTYISTHTLPIPTVPPSGGGGGGGGGSGGSGGGNPTPTPTPICNGTLSACSNGTCNVEDASQCSGCGGSGNKQCYSGLTCGGVNCSQVP